MLYCWESVVVGVGERRQAGCQRFRGGEVHKYGVQVTVQVVENALG